MLEASHGRTPPVLDLRYEARQFKFCRGRINAACTRHGQGINILVALEHSRLEVRQSAACRPFHTCIELACHSCCKRNIHICTG